MRSMIPMTLADFETAPVRVVGSYELQATPDAVFQELADPSLWFPLMRRSVWRTGATSGVDAQREVDVLGFGVFREQMLAWDVGRRLAFTMTASTSPLFARMGEDWQLEPTERGVRVTWLVAGTPTAIARPIAPALRQVVRVVFSRTHSGLAKRTAWSAGRVRGKQAV